MWNKIKETVSTAWLLALINIAVGIGLFVQHRVAAGIIITLLGVIYLAYSVYWSLINSGMSDKGAKIYQKVVAIIFAFAIAGSLLYMLLDIIN